MHPTAAQEIVMRITEMLGSLQKFLRAKERLAGVMIPSYRLWTMETRDKPFATRSSVDDQNMKTILR
jgi:hypothetical protein